MVFFRQSFTRSDVRLVSSRHVWVSVLGTAVCVGLAAFAGGLWLGSLSMTALALPAEGAEQPASTNRFTLERMGKLSGQLDTLEKDAHYLIKASQSLEALTRKLSTLKPSLLPAKSDAGEGGVLLVPRACEKRPMQKALGLLQAENTTRCLRRLFNQLLDQTAAYNATFMAVPSRAPLAHGQLGSSFGNRIDPFNGRLAFHSGQDFSAPLGAPIHAAAGGRVIAAGRHPEYGQHVDIDHGNGLITRYAHAQVLKVKVGDVVLPDQAIATVGSTGRSTGAHLHFEVLFHQTFVDPAMFLSLGEMALDADGLAAD